MLWHKCTVAQSPLTPKSGQPRRIGVVDHKLDHLCLPTDVLHSPILGMDGLMPLGDPSFAQAIHHLGALSSLRL